MVSLDIINNYLRISLFSLSLLCMLFFFYKMARHQDKSYGLLMVFILIATLFISAGLRLSTLLGYGSALFLDIFKILNKFSSVWIISLALYHYSILKSFKGKFKEFPFKAFILWASLVALTIALGTSFTSLNNWNGDFFIIHIVDSLLLLSVFFNTRRFRDEIKFGPYSVARESATILIRFALIQASFGAIYFIKDLLSFHLKCPITPSPEGQPENCSELDLLNSILYQCWIWYAILFNWKMVSVSQNNNSFMSSSSEGLLYSRESSFME